MVTATVTREPAVIFLLVKSSTTADINYIFSKMCPVILLAMPEIKAENLQTQKLNTLVFLASKMSKESVYKGGTPHMQSIFFLLTNRACQW